MSPLADLQHQEIAMQLSAILQFILGFPRKARVYGGLNVSDRESDWKKNYRVPDVAVIFPDNRAILAEAVCVGGPDFVVEIVSKGDRSRRKLKFYAAIGVRELLIIDRKPWSVELYRPNSGQLELAGTSRLDSSEVVTSEVVPLTFQLISNNDRPRIEVKSGAETWFVET